MIIIIIVIHQHVFRGPEGTFAESRPALARLATATKTKAERALASSLKNKIYIYIYIYVYILRERERDVVTVTKGGFRWKPQPFRTDRNRNVYATRSSIQHEFAP